MPGTAAEQFDAQAASYRARLLKFALLRLHNPSQAEDVVHDALLAAIEGMDRYAGGAALGTWLTGILKHKIVDCARKSARELAPGADPDDLASGYGDPEQAAWASSVLKRLDSGLAGLSANAARVFLMRDVIGMSTAETCSELSISTAYCAVLLYRARRRLREWFGACGMGPAA